MEHSFPDKLGHFLSNIDYFSIPYKAQKESKKKFPLSFTYHPIS